MSKKAEIQQTLDTKVFTPYQVEHRKLTFGGGCTIEKNDLEDKGPGLEPDKLYEFVLRGKLDSFSVKVKGRKGTIGLKFTELVGYAAVEVVDPYVERPKDEPAPEAEPPIMVDGRVLDPGETVAEALDKLEVVEAEEAEETITEDEVDAVIKETIESPMIAETAADLVAAADVAEAELERMVDEVLDGFDDELPEPSEAEPKPALAAVPDPEPKEDLPGCYGTWEDIPECNGCSLMAGCKANPVE